MVGRYSIDFRSGSLHEMSWPVVVLLHGIGVSGEYFLPFAEELARTCRVYVLDLPGYGTTPKPKRALNITELSVVVSQFLEDRGIVAAVLTGHSMGCQVALRIAEHTPEQVSKLVLLAPTVNDRERHAVWQLARLVQDSCIEPPTVTAQLLRDYARFGVWRYLQTVRYMLRDRPENRLSGCMQPTLVMRGEKDAIVPQVWAQRIADGLPDAQYVELPGQPHAIHYAAPVSLAKTCSHFIRQA